MTRNENDLRDALRDLDQRAIEHGGPSTESILTHTSVDGLGRHRVPSGRRIPRWLPPLAAAALVVAAAGTVAVANSGHSGDNSPAAGRPSVAPSTSPRTTAPSTTSPSPEPQPSAAAAVLDDAATKLAATPWTAPVGRDFFYVRSTEVTTWTSVSGKKEGDSRTTDGTKVFVPGCKDGEFVSSGQSGTCTLNDVPHFRADAPTAPTAWDAYLERMAPGARVAGAQGKIIVQVLHQDLIAPKAAAALLRYTETCPGLHTLSVRPVTGQQLIGVTCASMTAGSYGLTFDVKSHAFVGFVVVTQGGKQDGPAELVRRTGIVSAIGETP